MVNTLVGVLFCKGLKHFPYNNSNDRNPHKTQPSQLPKWSGPFMSLLMVNTLVGVVRFLSCLWAQMTVILLCGVSSRGSFDNLNRLYCKIYRIDHLLTFVCWKGWQVQQKKKFPGKFPLDNRPEHWDIQISNTLVHFTGGPRMSMTQLWKSCSNLYLDSMHQL